MPITTVYNPKTPIESAKAILREHLRDTFSEGSFSVTFEAPSTANITKPIIWMQLGDARTVRTEHFEADDGSTKTMDLVELKYTVTVITNEVAGGESAALKAGDSFLTSAILGGKPVLGRAGLRRADCDAFVPVLVDTSQAQWWYTSECAFDVYAERR
jgi:hypothetical protein